MVAVEALKSVHIMFSVCFLRVGAVTARQWSSSPRRCASCARVLLRWALPPALRATVLPRCCVAAAATALSRCRLTCRAVGRLIAARCSAAAHCRRARGVLPLRSRRRLALMALRPRGPCHACPPCKRTWPFVEGALVVCALDVPNFAGFGKIYFG